MKAGYGILCVCLLTACGATPSGGGNDEKVSSIELNLSTIAASGTEYRLGPATFDIFRSYPYDDPPLATIATDGAEASLHVPLEPNSYNVKLHPAWVLSRVEGETLTPVAATLLSPPEQYVSVIPFESTPVTYAFHLGEAGIDIGVTVDEGIPEGYDARLLPYDATQYRIEFRGGGGNCCYAGLAEAQVAYPYSSIYLAP